MPLNLEWQDKSEYLLFSKLTINVAVWILIRANQTEQSFLKCLIYLTRLSVEVVDAQLFLRQPSARRSLFSLRVAAACQRLCCASVRAPLPTLHRVRAFFWGIRYRHGYRSLITPHTQERESAEERSARIMRGNHARVKHLLEMFFSLHRDGASRINYVDR